LKEKSLKLKMDFETFIKLFKTSSSEELYFFVVDIVEKVVCLLQNYDFL